MKDYVKGGALTEVTFLILLSLYTPRHGYGIMQFAKEKTGGRVLLGAGTLYGALNALDEKGWITPLSEDGGRKKEYIITEKGLEAVQKELKRLHGLLRLAEEITGGSEYE